ncbi:hypothetical protein K440DRAFT_633057 [Wilcoxina mikolae CBS 423.85]|nr:hypothetical protein K440DRAFT_633057 [Wilcoxina mikolae CBS 423.85]
MMIRRHLALAAVLRFCGDSGGDEKPPLPYKLFLISFVFNGVDLSCDCEVEDGVLME